MINAGLLRSHILESSVNTLYAVKSLIPIKLIGKKQLRGTERLHQILDTKDRMIIYCLSE